MEPPAAAFLYTVSLLGMTFIGFSAIVMLLRQALGRKLRAFDVLFAHVYMEFGLIVSVGALLPSLIAYWGVPLALMWRVASAVAGISLLLIGGTYPARRRKATGEPTPMYVWVNVSFILIDGLALLADAGGLTRQFSAAVFLSCLTAFLTFAVGTWLRSLALVLVPRARENTR
jgi:hypothetical protein